MSWMEQLIKTYDENADIAGNYFIANQHCPLIPVCHTVVVAKLELTISENGNLLKAEVLTKQNGTNTIIPCTIKSSNRTGNHDPHSLSDTLQYIARDVGKYDSVKDEFHKKYIKQLNSWVHSIYTHPSIQSIYQYLADHDLIQDLLDRRILFTNDDGTLMDKWTSSEEKPMIFQEVANGDILKGCMVRFRVVYEDGEIDAVWQNTNIHKAYAAYYLKKLENKNEALCYATGQYMPSTMLHNKNIRYPGDQTKIISSNDTETYTYRGRFLDAEQCLSIGYLSSQKAINALSWLMRTQSGNIDKNYYYLVWGSTPDLPSLETTTSSLFSKVQKNVDESTVYKKTEAVYAEKFNRYFAGYNVDLEMKNQFVNILAVDAASNGRLAIRYYDEITANDYVFRLVHWHQKGFWRQLNVKGEKSYSYYGTPSPKTIIYQCFGDKVSVTKLKLMETRIFHCILNNQAIPMDLVDCIVKRVITTAIKNKNKVDCDAWESLTAVACSLIKNYQYERIIYNTMLDEKNTERSYLFGRILAIFDKMEEIVQVQSPDRARLTNAKRYFSVFVQQPSKGTQFLYKKIIPYMRKAKRNKELDAQVCYLDAILAKIITAMPEKMYISNKSLDHTFLLGFKAQQYQLNRAVEPKNKTMEAK